MNGLKLMMAGAAIGAIALSFRDFRNGGWLAPALPGRAPVDLDTETEPVLGYDGMDQETLIDWLAEANLDPATLSRIRNYEQANRNREPVLAATEDLM